MAFRRLPVEVKLDVLRYLNCANIFSLSLTNKSLRTLIARHRHTLPGRAIEICYDQMIASEVNTTVLDATYLGQLREMAVTVDPNSVLGALEILEIGTGKKLFRSFSVAEDDDEHRESIGTTYNLPENVRGLLRSLLVHDGDLAGVDRVAHFTNTEHAPLVADLIASLREYINVPIGEFMAYKICGNYFTNELDNQQAIKMRDAKRVAHFTYSFDVAYGLNVCTSFGGTTTFELREWDCDEDDTGQDGPSSLMEWVLQIPHYHSECRMLVWVGDCVHAVMGDAITPEQLLARIRTMFQHLYFTFNSVNAEPAISIPPHGVWLNVTEATTGVVPVGFWSKVFDGLAPVEVGQPQLVPHHEDDAEDGERYVCDIYELRAPHREKAMRVFVAHDDPERGKGLLIHLNWE